MRNTRMLALLLIASVSTTAMTAPAQGAPKPESREAVAEHHVDPSAQGTDLQLAKLNPVPDAPVPATKTLAPNHLAFAVPQQPPNQYPPTRPPNSTPRKYIVLALICA